MLDIVIMAAYYKVNERVNGGEFRKAIAQEEGRNIIPRPND